MEAALQGVDTIYYLVHSVTWGSDFAGEDRRAATTTVEAAHAVGVRRIIYLGGIVPPASEIVSEPLASRAEVGQIFLDGPVPAVVLQAGVIIGSRSAARCFR